MYTLAIDNVVVFTVKFTLKSGRVNKSFSVTLTANRLSKEESEAQADGTSVKDFLLNEVTNWSDQNLVLVDGKPADFSREAFEYMLSVGNVLAVVWNAYLKETGAKEKN